MALILDPYADVSVVGAFVPGLSGYRTVPVAVGSVALYALLLTGLTARYTKALPSGWWLKLHRLSLGVFLLSWAHGMLAGTDSDAFRWVYVATGLVVIAAAAYRYWVAKKRRPTFSTSLPGDGGSPRRPPFQHRSTDLPRPSLTLHARSGGPWPMTKSLKLRRTVVALGVVASLLVGLVSIEAAAALTAAAAPPPAPPMSLAALQEALAAQQQRGDELESQLVEMNELTASLSETLAGTQEYVTTQGKTAKELEKELKAAQAKLAKVQRLLDRAQARLTALRKAANGVSKGGGSGSNPGRHPNRWPPAEVAAVGVAEATEATTAAARVR